MTGPAREHEGESGDRAANEGCTYDVFVSYAHTDRARVQPLVAALRALGLKVWFDETDISTFEGITRAITQGLAHAKGLLAFYSKTYPTRRACQWELTAGFLAAQHEADAVQRVWVINPETDATHIEPVQLRDALFHFLPPEAGAGALAAAAEAVAKSARQLSVPFSGVLPLAQPPWYGGKGLGSNRFVGRSREFWTLHSSLFAPEAAVITGHAGPGHAQLRAMGGVGKSLLAEEYALRFGAAYPGGVFLLKGTAERDEQIYALAAQLGVDARGNDPRQVEGALEQALRARADIYLWWVDDLRPGLTEDERRRWFAPNAFGKTLITTRSREYGSTGGIIDLEVLSPDDGLQLLTLRRKPEGDIEHRAAVDLVAELGAHALAIDVAGGALAKLGRRESFAGFLAKLRNTSADALSAAADELRPDLPNGHDRSIARTLSISIALLEPSGLEFLRLAGLLAQDIIPFDLVDGVFQHLGVNATWGASGIVDGVADQCLAESVEQPNGASGYSVHALVRRAMHFEHRQVERSPAIRQAAVGVLLQTLRAIADGSPHHELRSHVAHARYLTAALNGVEEVRLLTWVGHYDLLHGAFASAQHQLEVVLEASIKLLGEEHDETLTARLNLASTLHRQGDLAGACSHEEAVLAARSRVLGAEHLHTLAAQINLADTLRAKGDLAGARNHQEAVLQVSGRLHGADHPATLLARENLAQTLKAQGDLAGARGHEEAALYAIRRLLGDEHPETLTVRVNLAATLKAQGDLAAALSHEEAALEALRRLLGEEHPNTLMSRLNLAGTLKEQGDLSAARSHEEAVLEACCRVLGDEHPHTLVARNNLANSLYEQGDLAGARSHLEAVLEASRQVLGDQHPQTLLAQSNLTEVLASH
jgi:tetratricopeptide (TPR) repeat protein